MFGHNVFTHPFEAQIGGTKRSTFLAEGSPMVSVKIDTTATNVSPNWEVTHQLPGWAESEPTKFIGYGASWTQYKTMPYVENNKGTHCFKVVESNDSAVPVGTTYGNCPDNGDEKGDENGEEPVEEEEKGTNWFLWGGIAAVVAVVFIV